MSEPPITVEEFEARLVALCAVGGGKGLPRRQRDIAILLASATLWMEAGSLYTEPEINRRLRGWLEETCPGLRMDQVTLRRELVDRNYLTRDDSGSGYAPGPGPPEWRFEDGVAAVDPARVIAAAAAEREGRKSDWARRSRPTP